MKTTVLMVIVFFASLVFAQDYSDFVPDETAVAKATAACGPDKIKFDVKNPEASQPLAATEAGKALVYMIEETPDACGFHCGVTTKVGLDGSWIGANQGNSYLSFAVDPGEHHLCVRWQSALARRSRLVGLANFTAEAGKTYYFRTFVFETESLGAHLSLSPINRDQGRLLVVSNPLSIAHAKR